jgi:anti-sigma B factor antagonist
MRASPTRQKHGSRLGRPVAIVRHRSAENLAEVAVFGDIDLTTAPALEVELRSALMSPLPNCVLVDLGSVPFMGVAGLQVLAAANQLAQADGVEFRVYGACRAARRSLDLSRVSELLDLYPDRCAATADLPEI